MGTVEGTVYLLDAGTLAVRKTLKEPKRTVAELKFSPDGTKLAVGGHDNVIHMYDVVRGKRVGSSEAHSSAIRHIDWSADSTHIQSVCQAYELLFHSVDGRNMTQVRRFPFRFFSFVVCAWLLRGSWCCGPKHGIQSNPGLACLVLSGLAWSCLVLPGLVYCCGKCDVLAVVVSGLLAILVYHERRRSLLTHLTRPLLLHSPSPPFSP